ncbi:MAG: metalloregulator ArsR/SmtB family transcription factor [Actinomycetota bacterium]|nr:metalloregulator ArsR/SmtB family transcription factor [Actinomycetota bacterium]
MKTLSILEDCCTPVLEAPLPDDEAVSLATAFKALGDPARLRLLGLVADGPGGERCVCELIAPLSLTQPTVSHHLKVLAEAGLLEREKRGPWVYYRVSHTGLGALRNALSRRPPKKAAAETAAR